MNIKNDEENIIRIEDGVPPLITKDTFDKAQSILKVNKEKCRHFKTRETYLLASKLVCGLCGGKMYGTRRKAGRKKSLYVTYQCTTRKNTKSCTKKEVNKESIENMVLTHLENHIFTEDYINKLAKKIYTFIQAEPKKVIVI